MFLIIRLRLRRLITHVSKSTDTFAGRDFCRESLRYPDAFFDSMFPPINTLPAKMIIDMVNMVDHLFNWLAFMIEDLKSVDYLNVIIRFEIIIHCGRLLIGTESQ
jgi:hypothetical protein